MVLNLVFFGTWGGWALGGLGYLVKHDFWFFEVWVQYGIQFEEDDELDEMGKAFALMETTSHPKINTDWWKRIHFCNLQKFWELIMKQFSSYEFWKNGQKMLKSEYIFKNMLKFVFSNTKKNNNLLSKYISFRPWINDYYYLLLFLNR